MDQIANMIIQIKNAGAMKKESVVLTHSNLKLSILECLVKAGFVASIVKKGKKVIKYIEVILAYEKDATGKTVAKMTDVKRLSKSSKRTYLKAKDIRPFKNGYGAIILSTPKGIMTGEDARKQNLGGEALFRVS